MVPYAALEKFMYFAKNPLRSRRYREAVWTEKADSFDVSVSEMHAICSGLESKKSPACIRKLYKLPYRLLSTIHQISKSELIPLRHHLNSKRRLDKKARKEKVLKTITNLDYKRLIQTKTVCCFCGSNSSLRSVTLRCVDTDLNMINTKVISCALCDVSRQGKNLTQWYASMTAQKYYGTDSYEDYKLRLRKAMSVNYDPILLNAMKQKRFQFYLAKRNN